MQSFKYCIFNSKTYQLVSVCLYASHFSHGCFCVIQCLLFVLKQDFLRLLWTFHSGWAPVLLPLCHVGAYLGADWTLASHGWCVPLLWLCQCVCGKFFSCHNSVHIRNVCLVVLQQVMYNKDLLITKEPSEQGINSSVVERSSVSKAATLWFYEIVKITSAIQIFNEGECLDKIQILLSPGEEGSWNDSNYMTF